MLRWLSQTINAANCLPSIVEVTGPQLRINQGIDKNAGIAVIWSRETLDHTFERHWIAQFFSSIIDEQAPPLATLQQYYRAQNISCEDLHNFFFGLPRSRNSMADFYNAMPGGDKNYLDLVGTSEKLNKEMKVSMHQHSPISEHIMKGLAVLMSIKMSRRRLLT